MLMDSDDVKMVNNYRPLQDLNNRTVYSSFNVSTPTDSTPTASTPSTEGPKADATAVSMTAALFLLMLVAAFVMH